LEDDERQINNHVDHIESIYETSNFDQGSINIVNGNKNVNRHLNSNKDSLRSGSEKIKEEYSVVEVLNN
jgi:hypothetical protein